LFFDTYRVTQAELLDRVYKQPFPNRYLAQFTKFISSNIHIGELENLVIHSFSNFITRNLLQYPDVATQSIHFTGSIAYHFKEQLEKTLAQHHLSLGTIEKAPMQNLIQYHLQNEKW
jgi:hypothetical protein